jgi:hypothetical protein
MKTGPVATLQNTASVPPRRAGRRVAGDLTVIVDRGRLSGEGQIAHHHAGWRGVRCGLFGVDGR